MLSDTQAFHHYGVSNTALSAEIGNYGAPDLSSSIGFSAFA
jgi:hypothetical protein